MYFIIFKLYDLSMSQSELSRRTGISTSTINDWKKKKINPQADKLVVISRALDMSLADLLGEDGDENSSVDYSADEKYLIECYRRSDNYVRKQHPKRRKKIKKRNIAVMLKMDGIDMIPDLRYRFTMKVVRLSGTMCLVQDY